MSHILLVGALDHAARTLIDQLRRLDRVTVTVYSPSRVTLPADVLALTGQPLDEGGLTAAMLGQDQVIALVPTIELARLVPTLITALRAAGQPRLVVSRTDDVVELPRQLRAARQALMAAQIPFDFVDGLGAALTLAAHATAVPLIPATQKSV
ncbi:hypothetical protein LZY01_19170 [Levilactobacillus zymae]|uniref:Pyrroline-5-carboxylate reductase catalytic N-terminal domain-containing protein n=1 Tax=Levilactobacillus zymae TaxID=267363 RepID=A0ABQ0WXW0_9LACO|nr:hypothetical protein [Levilactobacillus zymae]KRL15049.1 hypothetical protein FD38_GL001096 [Levilactobacillus zymae DSM 19395]QFR61628.1 hypothetical protein LZ395_08890 [Levilactobacillus zymae]GEO72749.1 hypothetical protein LZY01_19170 [Levilactobacillus zymae]